MKPIIKYYAILFLNFIHSMARIVFDRSGWRRNRESAPNSVSCAGRNQPPDGQGPWFWYSVGIGCHQESNLLPVVRTLSDDLARVVDPGRIQIAPAASGGDQTEKGLDCSLAVEEPVAHDLVVVVQRGGKKSRSTGERSDVDQLPRRRRVEVGLHWLSLRQVGWTVIIMSPFWLIGDRSAIVILTAANRGREISYLPVLVDGWVKIISAVVLTTRKPAICPESFIEYGTNNSDGRISGRAAAYEHDGC